MASEGPKRRKLVKKQASWTLTQSEAIVRAAKVLFYDPIDRDEIPPLSPHTKEFWTNIRKDYVRGPSTELYFLPTIAIQFLFMPGLQYTWLYLLNRVWKNSVPLSARGISKIATMYTNTKNTPKK